MGKRWKEVTYGEHHLVAEDGEIIAHVSKGWNCYNYGGKEYDTEANAKRAAARANPRTPPMPNDKPQAMDYKRWIALNESNTLPLTADEIARGWHFCRDWDGLLIGPGMGELDHCLCELARAEDKEMKLNRDARWWQFWNPYSGLPGGVITGSIGTLILWALYLFWRNP